MSDITLTSFRLEMQPNTSPKWQGSVPFFIYDENKKIITTKLNISTPDKNNPLTLSMSLYVEKVSIVDETRLSISGVPLLVRELTKMRIPSVITPSKICFDDSDAVGELNTSYNLIIAELFEDAVRGLFRGTSWSAKVAANGVKKLPVVTEAAPVIVLNGSLLEQLGDLLKRMSPNDLYGQGLNYYVNPFENAIIVTAPKGNGFDTISVNLGDLRPVSISTDVEAVDLPRRIFIQESEGGAFRTDAHMANYGPIDNTYQYSTSTTLTEPDADVTEIATFESGATFGVGDLVLTDFKNIQINQTSVGEILVSYGTGTADNMNMTYIRSRFTKGKSSITETTIEYLYLAGPPYQEFSLFISPADYATNALFTKSKGGSRQQISRGGKSVKINKSHYPNILYTTDGIRILEKKTTTLEKISDFYYYEMGGVQIPYLNGSFSLPLPDSAVTNVNESTTEITEVFTYSEDGNLHGNRTRKVVLNKDITGDPLKDEYNITETYKNYSQISSKLISEISYEITAKYVGGLDESNLQEKSEVTNVQTQTLSAFPSGPTATSVMANVENSIEFEERLLLENFPTHDSEPSGDLYLSVDTLTLDELDGYLRQHYTLTPENSYVVSFETEFADPRGIIGGSMKLHLPAEDNRPEFYNIGNVDNTIAIYMSQKTSKALDAVGHDAFNVSAITFDWENDKPLRTTIALCQIV